MTLAHVIESREQDIVTCTATATVEQAARLLAERRIGALPVFEDGKVIGIFSERDLLYCVAREGTAALHRPVSEAMTSPVITMDPSADLLEALALMTRRRIRHLPVLEEGQMIGFVSIGDLVKYRLETVEAEAQQMREYIRTA